MQVQWKSYASHGKNSGALVQRGKTKAMPDEMAKRLGSYQTYNEAQHGPLYCMDSVSTEITKVLHPQKDHTNVDLKKKIRNSFGELIWSNLGIPGAPADVTEIPIYHMYQYGFRRRVALDQKFLPFWLQLYRDRSNMELPLDKVSQIVDNLRPSSTTGWTHAKRVMHPTWTALREQLKIVDRLGALGQHFNDTVVDLNRSDSPITRFVALDIEAYEHSPRKLTEFGISTYDCVTRKSENFHIIITEHVKLRNKRFMHDAKDHFAFGKSLYMNTAEAMAFFATKLHEPGTALVGHSLKCDLKFIERSKVAGERISVRAIEKLPMYDLQYLFRCSRCSEMHSKLDVIVARLGIANEVMHNAGNDAALTMSAFLKLMGLNK
ncbi:DnaQ-like exo super family protein [Paramicrosporidium saccamoebae]|uniref:DnaQ-like exo super family protein n=1 Tax=Paramicrosporidium saccamoebae TaxID=1246581 RepID=A0A2H9TP60_9FUNG|nr:DnaQ-like exo super family protein [Paramicrosporidium saccamoebae]